LLSFEKERRRENRGKKEEKGDLERKRRKAQEPKERGRFKWWEASFGR